MRADENPFRTGRLDSLEFRPQGTDWPTLMEHLALLGYHAAFVGPEGSGKTAALEALARRLTDSGWAVVRVRLETGCRWPTHDLMEILPASLGSRDAVLLDSAEQLNWLGWQWFRWRVRRAGALIVATHRPGRLRTLHVCSTSGDLLGKLTTELLAPAVPLPSHEIATMHRRHSGNVRLALLDLYDQWAERTV